MNQFRERGDGPRNGATTAADSLLTINIVKG